MLSSLTSFSWRLCFHLGQWHLYFPLSLDHILILLPTFAQLFATIKTFTTILLFKTSSEVHEI